MRAYLTFFLVAVMTLLLGFFLVTRTRVPHDAPAEVIEPVAVADAGDAGVADARADADAAVVPPKPAERPLRVAALGWELVAAGVALDATTPAIELAPETALDAIEARLARGGVDPAGADIAILPLPAFVASYERLRALDPRAFAVVGFSRGREEVHAAAGVLLKPPAGTEEVRVVAFVPATAGDISSRAVGSESASVLGLFTLDLMGVLPARVRFVPPAVPEAKTALLSAIVRGATDDRKLAFSTADASRLVPLVAIAPKGKIDESEAKLRDFLKVWMSGVEGAKKDAAAVAQKLAKKEGAAFAAGVGGAPEAIALLERMGQVDGAKLADESTLIGAGARGPYTLETVLQRTWQLARGGGLATSAAPDPLPIDARVVAGLGLATPTAKDAADAGDADAGVLAFAALPAGVTPLVVYRADATSDAAAVAARIGFLSNVFERAAFRVSAKGGEKSARAIATMAKERFDVPMARLATTTTEPQGTMASVEIVALP